MYDQDLCVQTRLNKSSLFSPFPAWGSTLVTDGRNYPILHPFLSLCYQPEKRNLQKHHKLNNVILDEDIKLSFFRLFHIYKKFCLSLVRSRCNPKLQRFQFRLDRCSSSDWNYAGLVWWGWVTQSLLLRDERSGVEVEGPCVQTGLFRKGVGAGVCDLYDTSFTGLVLVLCRRSGSDRRLFETLGPVKCNGNSESKE